MAPVPLSISMVSVGVIVVSPAVAISVRGGRGRRGRRVRMVPVARGGRRVVICGVSMCVVVVGRGQRCATALFRKILVTLLRFELVAAFARQSRRARRQRFS